MTPASETPDTQLTLPPSTIEYPRCTESDNYLYSDCGSVGWAYVLFIFWNLLSM